MAPATLVAEPEPRSEVIPISRSIDRGGATEIRPGVKVPPSPKIDAGGAGPGYASFEAGLKQSESLRIAQSRITELERELERVRRDNEALSTAGDTLRRRADELTSKAESLEIQAREAAIRLEEEKKILRGQLQAKDRENAEMKARVEEIETRLESNFKKIRVRERELEHRLEIVKMENATLISTKDKMLLDLKRQIDQLHQESDSAKSKSQELFSQYKEKQETIRRVVRALRIALTILEGDDETVVPIKKAE
jgi:chromosome segregation ATPase